ncbi:MAG TPA: pitrilysin family protein [Myxococcota bacterium]|nr:pitrilysin family protein [Myxococcota bacterium]HOH76750.1 pitrilysin family protein [Myxococcota bacterium]
MKSVIVSGVAFSLLFAACGETKMKDEKSGASEVTVNPVKNPAIETFDLPNGLKVFMVVDKSAPLVAVDINYHVGSRNERPGKTGFAHLFEHMMFQGSKHYDDDYFKPLQDVGGQVNGATSTDRTRYWEIVPSAWLERALWLESDRMAYLLDAMTQERLDNQKSVVSNERRQNYDNRPYGTVWEKMAAALYPPQHPYSWLTIGSLADINAATREDVAEFFKTWYTPNNATLAIVGDIDIQATKELVTKYFGAIPPGPAVSAVGKWPVRLESDIVLDIKDRVQLPRTYITWPTVGFFDADEAALDVFGMVFGGGRTSRLYQDLVYTRQIAQDAMAGQRSSQIAGVFDIMLTPRPGVDPLELEKAALEILDEMLKNGITEDEMSRARTSIASSFIRDMENIGGFGGLADRINAYQHMLGRPDGFAADLQRYLDLDRGDVTRVAARYLSGARVIARVLPAGENAPTGPDAADRTALPGKGTDRAFDLPDRQVFELENGLQVVLVQQSRVPLVGFDLIVPGGNGLDPAGREGLASLTAAMLSEGCADMDSETFAKRIEALGASLNADADVDCWFVGGSAVTTTFRDLLDLAFKMVSAPTMDPAELERQRAERLTRLTQLLDMPQYTAMVAAQRAVYGDHPYGRPSAGTPESVKAITIQDVRATWADWFQPKNAVLIVVGDIDRDTLARYLNETASAWKNDGEVPDARLAPSKPVAATVNVVDMPGAHQSVIIVGGPAPARRGTDVATLNVLNSTIGGKFVSRLNLNLREDKGYTYGARSAFEMHGWGGMFQASASVATDVTGAATAEILRELNEIGSTRPVTPEELKYSVDAIVNGYSQRFSSIEKVASELLETYLYGLGADDIELYPSQVATVTTDQVTAAARTHLAPEYLSITIAGDAGKVVPQLRQILGDRPINIIKRTTP